jgi:hypothetical protein
MQIASIDEKAAAGEQKFVGNRNPDNPEYQQTKDGEIAIGGDPLEDGVFQLTMIASLRGESMQRAAIGIRPHSGWAAVVVVAGGPGAVEVIDRRKIVITAPNIKGAGQPYHFARDLFENTRNLPDAERYLAQCAAASQRLALDALREIILEARRRDKLVASCAILLAAGRALPALEKILASHPLIHTAEGEFFRQSFRSAGEQLKLHVSGIRERDLDECARTAFGAKANALKREIAGLAGTLGPPWTTDQKNACLAGILVLATMGAPGQ